MTPPVVAVDAFAGVGWGVACHRLGIREFGIEKAPAAIRSRSANGMRTIARDVWSALFHPWLVPAHRLYIASPPCQTFSMAGNGEGRKALADVLDAIDGELWKDPAALHGLTEVMDPRTALVLTPLAHIWAHRPELVALEQVPEVLPVWHAIAAVLRTLGYSVWAGILRAEQYGVPQTRKRAILMARLDGKVQPPTPTHSRYYSTDPGRLDQGVQKWVSMAEALGWDADDPREAHALRGKGQTERYGERPGRRADQPAPTLRANGGGRAPGGFVWKWADAPATTVTADPRITAREHHEHGEQNATSLKLTRDEAATLQSFPADFAWRGTKTAQRLQIGNAVPPVMGAAVLGALLAEPAQRGAWDLVFAEVVG
jgi:DNA (cytosine-5)-methyltransferase 1